MTNSFVSHNPIETHDFKVSSCQKCDFQQNHTTVLHFQIGMIQIKHIPVSGFGLIIIDYMSMLKNQICQMNHTCVTFCTREYNRLLLRQLLVGNSLTGAYDTVAFFFSLPSYFAGFSRQLELYVSEGVHPHLIRRAFTKKTSKLAFPTGSHNWETSFSDIAYEETLD